MAVVVHLQIRLIPPRGRGPSFPSRRLSYRPGTTTWCYNSCNHRRQTRLPLPPLRSHRSSDHDLLQAILSSSDDGGGGPRTHLPAVRSYESDLVRLTLAGDVGYDQAITAAAADGGDAAQEHLESGTPTMVVETLFPGSIDEKSTVSTRLFLPTYEVKGRARNLRSSTTAALLSKSVSRNILAMTFRQVVLQHVWSFQLELFPPGSERDMSDLPNPREISTYCTVSSSEPKVLAAIAEVICSFALNNTGKDCFDAITTESGVCLSKLPSSQIMMEAQSMIKTLDSVSWKAAATGRTLKHKWWMPPTYPNLERSLGSGVSSWVNDYVPAYKIQVDGAKFMDARFQGWQPSIDNKQEVYLTYFQLVELANILDMLYEDRFSTPSEHLSYSLVAKIPQRSTSKNSFWGWTLRTVVSGCFLLVIGVMTRFSSLGLFVPKEDISKHNIGIVANVDSCQTLSLEEDKLLSLCVSVIQTIKDALNCHEDITSEIATGAWMGELPDGLQRSHSDAHPEFALHQGSTSYGGEGIQILKDMSANRQSLFEEKGSNHIISAQDIATYQVVLSKDGKIVGFQPTNRIAVNHWSVNPLAKILHHNRMPSPCLVEPSLSIPQPEGVVLIELLLSVNPKLWFALARPLQY